MKEIKYERRCKKRYKNSFIWLLSFILSFLIIGSFTFTSEKHKLDLRKKQAQLTGIHYVEQIEFTLSEASQMLHLVYMMMKLHSDPLEHFTEAAEFIYSLRSDIININLAPDGIVSTVFPFERNKLALGHNLLDSPKRKTEALLALNSDQITIAGPLQLVQGGIGLAFRQAVRRSDSSESSEENEFWGFIIVTYEFPKILERVNLDYLSLEGYAWKLFRKHPDHGTQEVLFASADNIENNPLQFPINLPNAQWTLELCPINGWLDTTVLAKKIFTIFIFSILVATLIERMVELARQKKIIERQARSDTLTNLLNRRFFSERLNRVLDKYINKKNEDDLIPLICYFDLNDFKPINDTLGHSAGDDVLIEFSKRLSGELKNGEFASRIGGDEFSAVLYCPPPSENEFPVRLSKLKKILEMPYDIDKEKLKITVSVGYAVPKKIFSSQDGDKTLAELLLEEADLTMYNNKRRYHSQYRRAAEQAPAGV